MSNPWSNIERPVVDYNVRLVSADHPLKLYWGRDTEGRFLFIYDSTRDNVPEKQKLPELTGIGAGIAFRNESARLVLLLKENENWELFHTLCSDITRATSNIDDGPAAGSTILRRLIRWQDLLKKSKPKTLAIDAIKGLYGELLFLSGKIAPVFGWECAVNFWKGPEGAPQDFAVYQTAVEVKCQAGSTKPHIRVSSLEQLDPQLPEGYLVVYTIATTNPEDGNGSSLNDLVETIRTKIRDEGEASRERFEDLLYQVGYITTDAYEDPKFTAVSIRCFRMGTGFPRITPSCVVPGVHNVSYNVSLEACSAHERTPEWWKE